VHVCVRKVCVWKGSVGCVFSVYVECVCMEGVCMEGVYMKGVCIWRVLCTWSVCVYMEGVCVCV
jgi:hypothetical protein